MKDKRIFKYKLNIIDSQYIPMPQGSQILSVKEQNGTLNIWAIVDINNDNIKNRWFYIFGTGNEFDISLDDAKFIGTVVMSNGLVWHVFDGGETQ